MATSKAFSCPKPAKICFRTFPNCGDPTFEGPKGRTGPRIVSLAAAGRQRGMSEDDDENVELPGIKHKVIGLLSGGKDSCFNLLHCVANGHDIVALATLTPEPGVGQCTISVLAGS